MRTRDMWKINGRKDQKYCLYICNGAGPSQPRLFAGHVYKVLDLSGDVPAKFVGFMTLDGAKHRLGEGNIFITPSSTFCPECLEILSK